MAIRRGPTALAGERRKRSRSIRVLLGSMFGYLGRFKKMIAFASVLAIVATIFRAIDPVILAIGIDLVLVPGSPILGVIFLGALYAIFRFISWTLSSLYTWILSGAQAGFIRSLQQDVYRKLIGADLSYFRAKQSGDITSRVTTDTDNLAQGVSIVIDISSQLLLLIATSIIMLLVAPAVALTSLVVVPVVILIVVLFGTVGQRTMLASQRATGFVSGQIAENLSGIHVAKAFNREDETAGILEELNQESYRHGFRFMMLMTLMMPLVRATGIAATAAVLFVAGSLAVGTAPLLTIGEVFLGIILIQRFLWPLLSLSMMVTQFQAALSSMDRLMDVLEAEPTITDSINATPLKPSSDGITFDQVSFAYIEDTEVLKDATFEVQPGELVAIVGHTGAGKTTIAALINRFYDPQEGRILIGKQDIRDVTLESLHDTVALIAQEPYLFDDTVLENIRYGRPDATDEEIIELSRLIGAHDFIEVLPQGYDTMLSEGGKNLSVGQVQMISIARTMLADPKILILDEATSRLDAYSESLVQAAQEKLFANRTTVVIAHRLTTIANASRVLVFEHGELVEQGTHTELLALGGRYKAIYDTYYAHQTAEEISEEALRIAHEELGKAPMRTAPPDPAPKKKLMKRK
ncbi:MAG: ABC transporter ATP-binding protein [Candidatus Hermodarchaeota archaeon]